MTWWSLAQERGLGPHRGHINITEAETRDGEGGTGGKKGQYLSTMTSSFTRGTMFCDIFRNPLCCKCYETVESSGVGAGTTVLNRGSLSRDITCHLWGNRYMLIVQKNTVRCIAVQFGIGNVKVTFQSLAIELHR